MRKILVILPFLLLSLMSWSQLRTNLSIGGQINTSSAFLDASSTITWNSSDNIGKGLIFPSADLTRFTISASGLTGIGANYPSRFDGMIIYNTVAGTVSVKDGAETITVTPGFYFYSNKTTSLSGGTWLHMNDNQSTSIPAGASLPATTGHVAGDLYYVTGTGLYVFDGTAWTASGSVLADGSVTSAKIADDSILAEDIATGAVTTTEILDGTIQSIDIAPSAVAVAQLKTDGATDANMVYTTDANGTPALVAKTSFVGNTTFNGSRAVTRSGLSGITGTTFNTTDLAGFLEKVFFPAQSPYVLKFWINGYGSNSANYTVQSVDAQNLIVNGTEGSVSLDYSVWNGVGFPANLDFYYTIVKRDASTAITVVELLDGTTSLGTDAGGATGSISVPKTLFSSAMGTTKTITLKVTDAAGSVITTTVKVLFKIPNGVSIASARISTSANGAAYAPGESNAGSGTSGSPYLIDRADISGNTSLNFCWGPYTLNDDTQVTNVDFTSSSISALVDMTSGNYTSTTNVPFTIPNSNTTTVYSGSVQVKGNVANVNSSLQSSLFYKLQDRTYLGYIGDLSQPGESTVTGLTYKYLSTSPYYVTGGITLTNASFTSGHIIWAIPKYSGAFTAPTVWTNNLGTWSIVSNVTTYDMTIGGKSYWICIYNASVSLNGSSTVKLSN